MSYLSDAVRCIGNGCCELVAVGVGDFIRAVDALPREVPGGRSRPSAREREEGERDRRRESKRVREARGRESERARESRCRMRRPDVHEPLRDLLRRIALQHGDRVVRVDVRGVCAVHTVVATEVRAGIVMQVQVLADCGRVIGRQGEPRRERKVAARTWVAHTCRCGCRCGACRAAAAEGGWAGGWVGNGTLTGVHEVVLSAAVIPNESVEASPRRDNRRGERPKVPLAAHTIHQSQPNR